MREGKLDESVIQFTEALRLKRDFGAASFNLGMVLAKKGKLREAVSRYGEALRINPQDADAHFALGMALIELGNDALAIPQMTEVLRLRPNHEEAHYQLALILARQGRIEEAIAHNHEALILRPDWPEVLNNQAWLLATTKDPARRDPKRAVELSERARELADYKMPLVLDTQAAAYAAAGRFDEAAQIAAKALESARGAGQTELALEIEGRVKTYKAGKPFVDDVQTPKL
jgi:spermidine synthase